MNAQTVGQFDNQIAARANPYSISISNSKSLGNSFGGIWWRKALALSCVVFSVQFTFAQEVHFSPEERLDAIDAALIAAAKQSIDFASYSLTDAAVLDALNSAEQRGVAIRIVLDPRERHDFAKLGDLADNVRIKRSGPLMHLKSYAIDGQLLRTGSANFSASGERQQDNDLIVIRDAGAAAKFDAHFERMWDAAQPMDEFEPAIRALEPH
jgi:phosphatidylserine/phosphatidylglycerophosphate/cardiolipin synthase-like enzyme